MSQCIHLTEAFINMFVMWCSCDYTCVLKQAAQGLEEGVYFRYRFDGSIFNLRRLTSKTKTLTDLIREALFADDCALMAGP